jgi:flagellar hook-associated protein 1 FlgK
MSLTQALATAVTGLRAAQTGLSVTAGNVANAETPGYVRKTPVQIATAAGDFFVGVRVVAINRQLDFFVQQQMRIENSGASYATLRSQFYDRLQTLYGSPGADSALESIYNNFTSSLQALSTSPELSATRTAALNAAQVLVQHLHGMTTDIQGLRNDAEQGIAEAIARANTAMQRIAQLNQQLGSGFGSDATTGGLRSEFGSDATTANLLDQRDFYIDELAQIMDIKVIRNDNNQVTVFTNSGAQLVGLTASKLAFDASSSMTASSQWSRNPAERTVGTITLEGLNGGSIDLIADRAIRSGEIAAYLEMRDQVLVQAQTQLDQIAAAMARALSDRAIDGTAVTAGPQSGFDIDLSPLQDGNTVRITYTDNAAGQQRTLTLMRVDDASLLPLSNNATVDPNDTVIGIDFSGGMASIVSQIAAAMGGSSLQFSNPAGNTLRILDDGAANLTDVNAVVATATATSLTGGTPELPFFLDQTVPFTGAIRSTGLQSVGFAGRITINGGLLADPSRLVVYGTSPLTPAGDTTRPAFLFDRLTNGRLDFSPTSGVGTATAPFNGTLPGFLRQVISNQGAASVAAANLKDGQDIVFNSLKERFDSLAGVNIDEEMSNLLTLQNTYAANARVLSVVKEMYDALLNT